MQRGTKGSVPCPTIYKETRQEGLCRTTSRNIIDRNAHRRDMCSIFIRKLVDRFLEKLHLETAIAKTSSGKSHLRLGHVFVSAQHISLQVRKGKPFLIDQQ